MPSNYKRRSGERKPRKIYICCEDEIKEKEYYEQYINSLGLTEAEVETIHKKSGHSAPKQVYGAIQDKIQELKDDNKILGIEEFWLSMDIDWWGPHLEDVITKCKDDPKLHPIVSNPFFEIWLLAHHYNVDDIVRMSNSLITKADVNNRLSQRHLSGKYDRDYFPYTDIAISNSKGLDTNPTDDRPNSIGSRIYKLIEALLEIKNQRNL